MVFIFHPWAWSDRQATYLGRYLQTDLFKKQVDNFGNGFEELYGVRNFRSVLPGIHYRGGANNYYHRVNPRANENPLPDDGLKNLCEEGFGVAIYLYAKNFSTAPTLITCRPRFTWARDTHQMRYQQISPFSETGLRKILNLIHDVIQNEGSGPVYTHCWNGWHASGLVSAAALRQFCDWSGDEAVSYWDQNTDGNDDEPGFEAIRQTIRNFVPYEELRLSGPQKQKICPLIRSYSLRSYSRRAIRKSAQKTVAFGH